MAVRKGNTLILQSPPQLLSWAAIGSKMEGDGPLGDSFDLINPDGRFGEDSWEKAESYMQKEAVRRAIEKCGISPRQVDVLFAGDLLNQCISSTYGLRDFGIPFLGIYGACSTMAQGLVMSSLFVEGGFAQRACAVTSSHFCSAERQFRFPLEYGSQRPPSAQWTATASGAVVVGSAASSSPDTQGSSSLDTQGSSSLDTQGSAEQAGSPRSQGSAEQDKRRIVVKAVTIGCIKDMGITDANNMGAAMAPAAADTLRQFFRDSGMSPADFDAILTGDLGLVGSDLLRELLAHDKLDLAGRHSDCGLLLYDRSRQQVDAGASGCGCSASVLCSHLLPNLQSGLLGDILFMATGALMSPTALQQGESIPGIAHLVWLSSR